MATLVPHLVIVSSSTSIPISRVQTLTFNSFNLPLPTLPSSITEIRFGEHFNQPVDTSLFLSNDSLLEYPSTKAWITFPPLTELKIDSHLFGHPLDHLPPHLLTLKVVASFNMPLDHLPSSLTYLTLASPVFNNPLDNLPPSLTTLYLALDIYHAMDHLPSSLKEFIVYGLTKQ